MENSKIAALVELGILCRGVQVEPVGDGRGDPGPHRFSDHPQLCRFENPVFRHPFEDPSVSAYALFESDTTIERALSETRLVVLLGMADSPQLRAALASKTTVVILFEPDERVLVDFLERFKLAGLNRPNLFCFTGDPRSFDPPLQEMLPGDMFRLGTPAFFVTDRVSDLYGDWADRVAQYFETLHYRHAIYGLSGQALNRSRPLRDIHRGLLYDQQLHAFENVGEYLTAPPIGRLHNRLRETDAILVAAGPDLPEKLDWIKANRERGVVISVNNAVKPLAEAGIQPHFVVINDTSVDSGMVFKQIPKLPGTILVSHCLSDLGGDRFRQKYLFGSFLPQIFGERDDLRLHGSVISTAFSLARYLGCARCVLVGAQLASPDPWRLSYAKGTVHEAPGTGERELINRHPQLCPVTSPFGEALFTTLNFMDAALWLTEEIRVSGVPCVNTSKASILYGEGIEYDEEPELSGRVPNMKDLFRPEPPSVDRAEAGRWLRREIQLWTSVGEAARTLLADDTPAMTAKGMAVLDQLDKNNVTYLVERRGGFPNRVFSQLVFEGDEASRRKGLRMYFRDVLAMSREFLGLLAKALKRL
ncbi:6-hydroxymethylpterin diphosphokinase MptE-like protein [uncultured Pseudodesulfovibrio sp.]|uniref:6-hydroxymethylpterin diphosphokinase MptE-like protein n=1 Tax=uncultured Pseudodesulfovibrio sp. TaxID=2035858 RepID=UPI00374A934C